MTTTAPDHPTVLNTTTLSNFAYVDRVDLLASLARVCTVPVVRKELNDGTEDYPYLTRALDALGDTIPVVAISEAASTIETDLRSRIDPGEAQTLAVAAAHDGRILTDDGDARTLAAERDIDVNGSIGVLLAAVDDERIDAETADRWLKRWIDETGYYVPYRDFSAYQ